MRVFKYILLILAIVVLMAVLLIPAKEVRSTSTFDSAVRSLKIKSEMSGGLQDFKEMCERKNGNFEIEPGVDVPGMVGGGTVATCETFLRVIKLVN